MEIQEQAGAIKNTEIARELCLPPVKLHCSSEYNEGQTSLGPGADFLELHLRYLVLAEDAIQAAIKDYKKKRATASAQGRATAGFIDVEQSAATGATKAEAVVGGSQ